MRTATIERKTKETDIALTLCLDGGAVEIDTGVGFFDHMLNSFATHGGFGLSVRVKGDLHVDEHPLGDKGSIDRFGSFYVPMDEALAFAAVDVSGRPFLVFDAQFPQARCGGYDCAMTVEFMRALAVNAGVTLHLKSLYGDNSHHITEALYKAAAHALRLAVRQNDSGKPLSTKGVL